MPFVAAKCTQCGAPLEVDSSKDAAICPFCNTPYIVQDAITNYNTTIINESVHSIEKQLESAETFLTAHKDYAAAEEIFRRLTKDASAEYRAWWGLARALTGNLSDAGTPSKKYSEAERCKNRAVTVAPQEAKSKIESEWKAYSGRYDADVRTRRTSLTRMESKLSELRQRRDALVEQRAQLNDEASGYVPTASLGASAKVGFGCGCASFIAAGMVMGVAAGTSTDVTLLVTAVVIIVTIATYSSSKSNERSELEKKKQASEQLGTVDRQIAEIDAKIRNTTSEKAKIEKTLGIKREYEY